MKNISISTFSLIVIYFIILSKSSYVQKKDLNLESWVGGYDFFDSKCSDLESFHLINPTYCSPQDQTGWLMRCYNNSIYVKTHLDMCETLDNEFNVLAPSTCLDNGDGTSGYLTCSSLIDYDALSSYLPVEMGYHYEEECTNEPFYVLFTPATRCIVNIEGSEFWGIGSDGKYYIKLFDSQDCSGDSYYEYNLEIGECFNVGDFQIKLISLGESSNETRECPIELSEKVNWKYSSKKIEIKSKVTYSIVSEEEKSLNWQVTIGSNKYKINGNIKNNELHKTKWFDKKNIHVYLQIEIQFGKWGQPELKLTGGYEDPEVPRLKFEAQWNTIPKKCDNEELIVSEFSIESV